MTVNGVTLDLNAVWACLCVLFALCVVGTAVLTFREKVVKIKTDKSKATDDQHDDIMTQLEKHKARLDAHETAILDIQGKQQSMERGQRVVCAGVMALLQHQLHNGNSTQMEQASCDINQYLLNK